MIISIFFTNVVYTGIVNMYKVGTMNFYHVDANESQWAQVADLVNHVNELVQEVSQKRAAGGPCCESKNL